MVRVYRTPSIAKQLFSANQLSGWPDGVAYAPRLSREERKERRKRLKRERLERQERSKQVIVVTSAKAFSFEDRS